MKRIIEPFENTERRLAVPVHLTGRQIAVTMAMSTRFILLSAQRSGSTWVIDMLNSHPHVSAYSELLLQGAAGTPKWGGRKDMIFWETFRQRMGSHGPHDAKELLYQYLDRIYEPGAGVDAAGFKLMHGQLGDHPELEPYLVDRGVHVVHLIRSNVLDVIVSKNAAAQRGVFHAREGEPVPPVRVRLDAGKLLDRLQWEQEQTWRYGERLRDLGLPCIELRYEELQDDHERFRGVLEFLRVRQPEFALRSTLRKLVTIPHLRLIENFEQVRETLAGTAYESMLR